MSQKEILGIFAPSASGKTTFMKEFGIRVPLFRRRGGKVSFSGVYGYMGNGYIVLDGDDLINWPGNKSWFREGTAGLVHTAQLAMILTGIRQISLVHDKHHLVFMFNGGIRDLNDLIPLYLPDERFTGYLWLPKESDHRRNIDARILENEQQGRSWTFPRDWGEAQNNRESLRAATEALGLGQIDHPEVILLAPEGEPEVRDKGVFSPAVLQTHLLSEKLRLRLNRDASGLIDYWRLGTGVYRAAEFEWPDNGPFCFLTSNGDFLRVYRTNGAQLTLRTEGIEALKYAELSNIAYDARSNSYSLKPFHEIEDFVFYGQELLNAVEF